MLIGYARTSMVEQVAGLDAQETALAATGCNKVFSEQASSVGQRDQLAAVLGYTREDDTLGVTRSNDLYAFTGRSNLTVADTVDGLNRLTMSGTTALGYDARGNVTGIGAAAYGYSSENLLTSAPGGVTLSYDPLLRLAATVGTTTTRFLYDGDAMIGEYDAGGALLYRYVHGPGVDEPLVRYDGAGTVRRWLIADERGSVVAVTSATGAPISGGGINRYDEYGVPATTNVGRFGYTGQTWLPELGMWYYKARMYAPGLGRFMQTDPVGYDAGMNLYAYVGGDPVNRVDPTGLMESPVSDITVCGGTTISFANGTEACVLLRGGGGGGGFTWWFGGGGGGGGFGGGGGSSVGGGGGGAPEPQKGKYPTICERRDWHNLKVDEKVAALRAAGFDVAVNVRIARFPSLPSSYAVADYIARAPGSTPRNSIYYLGEVKTGDADLTPNQRVNYYSGLTQIRSSNAANIGLLKNEVIPVIWNGVDRFPGCQSK